MGVTIYCLTIALFSVLIYYFKRITVDIPKPHNLVTLSLNCTLSDYILMLFFALVIRPVLSNYTIPLDIFYNSHPVMQQGALSWALASGTNVENPSILHNILNNYTNYTIYNINNGTIMPGLSNTTSYVCGDWYLPSFIGSLSIGLLITNMNSHNPLLNLTSNAFITAGVTGVDGWITNCLYVQSTSPLAIVGSLVVIGVAGGVVFIMGNTPVGLALIGVAATALGLPPIAGPWPTK